MKRLSLAIAALPLLAAAPSPEKPALAPLEIVAAAPAADWVRIAPADLMVMELAPDAKGRGRRVVIQLMPPPFSQGWVGNIRKLVSARWFDGVSVNRVQDNYVTQWGDAEGEDPNKAKKLPEGLMQVPEPEYLTPVRYLMLPSSQGTAHLNWPNPWPIMPRDNYAAANAFWKGWPIAGMRGDGMLGEAELPKDRPNLLWPVHCYGMVGVGRGLSPDTGSGAELCTVIGHAPRHLDRNIALVGRVIEGIEHLSSLQRGTEALGFYKTVEERTPIASVRIGHEVKDLSAYEYLSTESKSFVRYADARANRRDVFFNVPAGGADICNIFVPVRRAKG